MIGFAKGGFSGLGALLTPILALVLPVASAVGVLLPMLMVGDVFAVYMYWKEWDLDLVKRMLPAGIVGALAGHVPAFVGVDEWLAHHPGNLCVGARWRISFSAIGSRRYGMSRGPGMLRRQAYWRG